jgi:flagellum-specific peptidoglycan hydrolase FlgJ
MADQQKPKVGGGNKSGVDSLKFMKKQEKAEEKQADKAAKSEKPIANNSFFARIQQFADKMPETAESALQRNAIDPRIELATKEPTRYKY